MEIITVLAAAGAVVGSFVLPIRWLHGGQSKMKSDMAILERRSVRKDEMERMITLYTDPIKEDVHATKKGVEGLLDKFHNLELMMAREFGSRKNKDETK